CSRDWSVDVCSSGLFFVVKLCHFSPQPCLGVFYCYELGNNRPPIAVKATEARLLRELAQFENEKGYLKPVKLEELAQQWGTNRNTLSALINTHKGSFNTYLNKLRIEQLMIDLKNQKELRRLSLTQLANQYGFANAKSLAIQFKAQTDLPPMYFIQQL